MQSLEYLRERKKTLKAQIAKYMDYWRMSGLRHRFEDNKFVTYDGFFTEAEGHQFDKKLQKLAVKLNSINQKIESRLRKNEIEKQESLDNSKT